LCGWSGFSLVDRGAGKKSSGALVDAVARRAFGKCVFVRDRGETQYTRSGDIDIAY